MKIIQKNVSLEYGIDHFYFQLTSPYGLKHLNETGAWFFLELLLPFRKSGMEK
jgi:hypothetical protein